MSVQVKHRREAAAFLTTFVGAQGELIVDTTNNRIQVHDGSTPGGFPAAKLSDVVSTAGFATNGANANITSLSGLTTPLSLGQGGTGGGTAVVARTALGAAASGANGDITSLSGLSAPLSLGQGGTGGSNAATARSALGAAASGSNGDITSLSAVASINGGPLAGFRNRIRNGNFAINQRGVSGTVTLAAGAYGHDGVKAGASGATYTFTASGIDTVLTITAGSLILPIEAGLVEGGAYALNWTGTATGRVYQGSATGAYAASPFRPTSLTSSTQVNCEFTAGTLGLVQFEPGAVVTAFERRMLPFELDLCQRYYNTVAISGINGTAVTSTLVLVSASYRTMRVAPTVGLLYTTITAGSYQLYVGGNAQTVTLSIYSPSSLANSFALTLGGFSGLSVGQTVVGNIGGQLFSLNAEL